MVVFEIHTDNIKTKYKSTFLSKATFLVAFCKLTSIILPFILAYHSKGFWLKRDTFYEQPNIKFLGEYLFVATTNNLSHPIICGTLPHPHQYEQYKYLDMCSIIKTRENDIDSDGKIDELNIYLNTNLEERMKITSFNLFLNLNYKLNTVCRLEMQSAIIYQDFLIEGISDYAINADLITFQSGPLYCKYHKNKIHNFYNYTINTEEKLINDIIEDYSKRNVSTHLTNVYRNILIGNRNKFSLSLTVRYPEQQIFYKPGLWQMLKWAWIQYFAVYLIISWFVAKLKDYIFNKRLVLFYKECPLNKIKQN